MLLRDHLDSQALLGVAAEQTRDLEALGPDSPAVKTLIGPAIDAGVANTPGWRLADIGAANRHRSPVGSPDHVSIQAIPARSFPPGGMSAVS